MKNIKQIKNWSVLKYTGEGLCLCRCTCGNTQELKVTDLVKGLIPDDCGHSTKNQKTVKTKQRLYRNDLINKKFGEWTVLRPSVLQGKVLCQCSCGKQENISVKELLDGSNVRCNEMFHSIGLRNMLKDEINSLSEEELCNYVK